MADTLTTWAQHISLCTYPIKTPGSLVYIQAVHEQENRQEYTATSKGHRQGATPVSLGDRHRPGVYFR